jgi:hypothetical protein
MTEDPDGDYVKLDDIRGLVVLAEESRECLEKIRSGAPSACELTDCNYLPNAVRTLLEFAWRATLAIDGRG